MRLLYAFLEIFDLFASRYRQFDRMIGIDPDDIETLEDLITAAVNEALRMVEEESSQNINKLTGGLGGGFPF